ncbi:glycosyltransferase family 2 protein [Baekduia sp. Peel2402]|uniref:glycosyltransferase family 2 protein n=1 Tax=Baekduia sp. Peel2402 TaxID=3458296 RepID=UPI00403EA50D
MIPTVGGSGALGEIAQSALTGGALEVVVVDDRRGPAADVGGLHLPDDERVRVIAGGGRGPGPARAAGAAAARGDVVLLLDDDVAIEPEAVAGHAARHASTEDLVVLGPMPLALGAREPFPRVLYAADYARASARWAADPGQVLERLWTGNVSLRRDVALRVGLHSPAYDGYRHEDRDLGLRCRAAGLTGVWAPELRAVHRYERAPERFFADARAQGAEQALLARLHPQADVARRPADLLDGVPRPLRPVLGLAAGSAAAAASMRVALRGALALAKTLGSDRATLRLAQLRRRVEQLDGWARPGMRQ